MTPKELFDRYCKDDSFDGVVTWDEYAEIALCLEANKPSFWDEDTQEWVMQQFLFVGPNGRLMLFGVELRPQVAFE